MRLIIPILLSLFFSACTSDNNDDTPKNLMVRIHKLAEAGQYSQLEKELYPLTSEHYPLRQYMLQYIKEEDTIFLESLRKTKHKKGQDKHLLLSFCCSFLSVI